MRYGYARIVRDIESPIEVLSSGHSDSCASGVQKRKVVIEDTDFPDNKIRAVVGPTQTKRLAETTRSTTQSTIWAFGIASVRPHHFNSG
jgi:hypothetical protein